VTAQSGLQNLRERGLGSLKGARVGLLANHTAVDEELRPASGLLQALGADLRVLFGPEHGIYGVEQDMIPVDERRCPVTGLPVVSLYGHDTRSLTPASEHLAELDALVFDIQDVGSRYYTYVYSLLLAMQACARAGVRVVVLDRPNPIGGLDVEGNSVAPEFRSFVGMVDLPNRHGMTAGELARFFAAEEHIDVDLEVVPVLGWPRGHFFEQTGLPWVMPSPNMPTVDTATVYPGQCLLEGTTWSEGRGTTRPFELFGAPALHPFALCAAIGPAELPGALLRPLYFRPQFQKHAGALCGGLQLHVTDRAAFRPWQCSLAILSAALRVCPDAFGWRTQPYEFVSDRLAIDLLCGTDRVRKALEAGAPASEIAHEEGRFAAQFRERRAPYLLYAA
jgi:uncharacterized protein YbbC (DUF1343 family)